jgi:excisionase family DNA binding protein
MDQGSKGTKSGDGGKGGDNPMSDMVEPKPPVNLSIEEFEKQAHIELHRRGRRHERDIHIDLSKEDYTPDEIASMLGTSLEVVMHAVWSGELKAERAGHDVVCIKHEDVTDWLRRRGSGV